MNIQLNERKSQIRQRIGKFVGHEISAEGIKPAAEKVELIRKFKAPENKEHLRSFLGLVGYVMGRQRPDETGATKLLRSLTQAPGPFEWDEEHAAAFEYLKNSAENIVSLGFFDKNDRTRLYADASPTDLGAVLVQYSADDTPRVVQYATKSLTPVQKRYSQTDREALALAWGTDKFGYFLRGREFELITALWSICFARNPSHLQGWSGG